MVYFGRLGLIIAAAQSHLPRYFDHPQTNAVPSRTPRRLGGFRWNPPRPRGFGPTRSFATNPEENKSEVDSKLQSIAVHSQKGMQEIVVKSLETGKDSPKLEPVSSLFQNLKLAITPLSLGISITTAIRYCLEGFNSEFLLALGCSVLNILFSYQIFIKEFRENVSVLKILNTEVKSNLFYATYHVSVTGMGVAAGLMGSGEDNVFPKLLIKYAAVMIVAVQPLILAALSQKIITVDMQEKLLMSGFILFGLAFSGTSFGQLFIYYRNLSMIKCDKQDFRRFVQFTIFFLGIGLASFSMCLRDSKDTSIISTARKFLGLFIYFMGVSLVFLEKYTVKTAKRLIGT